MEQIIIFTACILASIAMFCAKLVLFTPYDLSTELTDNANQITENNDY